AGGKTDLLSQRVMDIMQALPILVLALVLAAALGPSLTNAIVAISIPIVPRAARIIRASVLAIRELTYVESARALGARHVRVALRHILPNTMGPFIVLATAQLGGSILVAVAGRRRATLDLAQRLEAEGFTGIYCPSPGDGMALCEALALVTREIPFGTSIAHIYTRHAFEWAQTAAVIHELSGGRFRF